MTSMLTVTGWTLIHFLWQGALVAAAAAVALRLAGPRSARARYAIACAALCAMLAAPVVTARLMATAASPVFEPASSAVTVRVETRHDEPAATGVVDAVRATPTAARIDPEQLVAGLTIAWLCGVSLLFARLCGGWWYVRTLYRSAIAANASRWQAGTDRIARRLRLSSTVHVVESSRVDVPTVVGWIRPAIVLPMAAIAALTPAQVEAILAHELAHIRRHDYAVNLLQTVAETLLFYHPAVWWLSNRIRAEREHCCDDVAIEVCGDPVGYARALADLETFRAGTASLAMAATGGSLVERIARILRVPRGDSHSPRWAATLVLTLLFTAGAGSIARLPRLAAGADGGMATASAAPGQRPARIPSPPSPPATPEVTAPPAPSQRRPR